jgi:hypothetical protein
VKPSCYPRNMGTGVVERVTSEPGAGRIEHRQEGDDTPLPTQGPSFRRAYWLTIPFLAIAAYASVLRVGFLGDDYPLYIQTRETPFGLGDLLPHQWFFYRPLSTLFTWVLGVHLWGTNPVPYHLISLLLHAAASLALGLWLAEVTSRKWLGLLAGCLFAVFPLHLEAVGWIAAQWDLWAAMFGLLSLWLFTVWWRRPSRAIYTGSLACYFLGVFSKESLLTWLPVLAVSVWAVTPRFTRDQLRKLLLALLPFLGVLVLNIAIRYLAWGSLGGYPDRRSPSETPYFDTLVGYLRFFLAPFNPALIGGLTQQIASLVVAALLFVGLIWYGRAWRRLLLVSGAWVLLLLGPTLNLGMQYADLQNNRFTYLPIAGYCVLVALLLGSFINEGHRLRNAGIALTGLLLLAFVAISWVQLRPWHTATVQMQELGDELARLIPPQTNSRVVVWNVENPPDNYKGAYLLRTVMGEMRHITTGDYPIVAKIDHADKADLVAGYEDKFALRFFFSQGAERFHVSYASGLTSDAAAPSSLQLGESPSVWDFTSCAPNTISAWQIAGGTASCHAGQGLVFVNASNDVQMVGPQVSLDPQASRARFVRLRAAVSYPTGQSTKAVSQWFWQLSGQDWSAENSASSRIRSDGKTHVYWTFVPASDLQGAITRLRFDPLSEASPLSLKWMAVDLVK